MMRIKIFHIKIDLFEKEEFIYNFNKLFHKKNPSIISTVNIEFIDRAILDKSFFDLLNKDCTYNLLDGNGVIWAHTTLTFFKPKNQYLNYIFSPIYWLFSLLFFPLTLQFYKKRYPKLSGSDLIWDICKYASLHNKRVFLLGYKYGLDQNSLEKASLRLQTNIADLKIAGILSTGGEEKDDKNIIQFIKKTSSDILLCGLGSPLQERWLKRNLKKSGCHIGIGLGGTFDFISGAQKRAPKFVQRAGFEWLYRLIRQPRRAKRQLALARVAISVLKQRIKY